MSSQEKFEADKVAIIAKIYQERLSLIPGISLSETNRITVNDEQFGLTMEELKEALDFEKIGTTEVDKKTLALPLKPSLNDLNALYIVQAINKIYAHREEIKQARAKFVTKKTIPLSKSSYQRTKQIMSSL